MNHFEEELKRRFGEAQNTEGIEVDGIWDNINTVLNIEEEVTPTSKYPKYIIGGSTLFLLIIMASLIYLWPNTNDNTSTLTTNAETFKSQETNKKTTAHSQTKINKNTPSEASPRLTPSIVASSGKQAKTNTTRNDRLEQQSNFPTTKTHNRIAAKNAEATKNNTHVQALSLNSTQKTHSEGINNKEQNIYITDKTKAFTNTNTVGGEKNTNSKDDLNLKSNQSESHLEVIKNKDVSSNTEVITRETTASNQFHGINNKDRFLPRLAKLTSSIDLLTNGSVLVADHQVTTIRIPKSMNAWAITGSLGMSLNDFNYQPNIEQSDYANTLSSSVKQSYRFHFELGTQYRFHKNWHIGTGLEYSMLTHQFNIRHIRDSVALNALGKSVSVEAARSVRHQNFAHLIRVPVQIGYQYQLKQWTLGLEAGLGFNWTIDQKGKTLSAYDEVVSYTKSSSQLPIKQQFIDFHISPFVQYNMSSNWALQVKPQFRLSSAQMSTMYKMNTQLQGMGIHVGLMRHL